MKTSHILFAILAFLAAACSSARTDSPSSRSITVPFRGNVYVTAATSSGPDFPEAAASIIDTFTGKVLKWDSPDETLSLYISIGNAGKFKLAVNASAGLSEKDCSTLRFTVEGSSREIKISGNQQKLYNIGTFKISKPGYIRIDINGINRTAGNYADISSFTLSGNAIAGENHFIPSEKLADVYWFRRGPSVHMNYEAVADSTEYFYNEVTVPEGADVDGTYFMLTGFGEGYMGIQAIRNPDGSNANLVLFSVWSPFNTDNPDEIPDSLHVKALAHGKGVTVQDFGHEGSGKQSFMHFPWQTGKTYRTMVRVHPDGKGNTVYSGYFGDENGNWHHLSTLLRPATDTWYTHMHSFLECFLPETSILNRKVCFSNMWARDVHGTWHPVVKGTFTCDNTGISGVRTDFGGGSDGNSFYLTNCGFFTPRTPYGSVFTIEAPTTPPDIDCDAINLIDAAPIPDESLPERGS